MDEGHNNWEIVQEPEKMGSRDATGSGPPRIPEKVALPDLVGSALVDTPVEKPRKHQQHNHHREHMQHKDSRYTGDVADGAIQGTERHRKHRDERLSQSRDDADVGSRSSAAGSGDMAMEVMLWRENAELKRQVEFEKARADQAERVAEEMRTHAQIREQQLKSNVMEAANGNETLVKDLQNLGTENQDLKAELDDARSHIFSLQPYRQELTPKEVSQDFDDVVLSVSKWVQKFADPIVDNEDNFNKFCERATQKPELTRNLRRVIASHPDLVHGCLYPETDVDILISIVLRYLNDYIFQKVLFAEVHGLGEAISQIEGSMQANVEPKRDRFAIRTWRGEALNAIMCSPDYKTARANRVKELTLDLTGALKLFRKDRDHVAFCYSCQDNVIKPAVALHEKLLTSTHHFYMDINPYVVWNEQQGLEMSADFLDNLDNLQCDNILQNRKAFNLAKLDPQPTNEELRSTLSNVLTVVPGLYMRQIGKGDAIKPPIVVKKQQVLVAYGPPEKKQKFMERGERTLMSYLYFSQKEKQERAAENQWSMWRQIAWG